MLFNHSQKREAAKWGVGDEEMKKEPASGDPEDYAHLSLDEKKELTQKMLAQHKGQLRGAMRNK